MKNIFRAFRYDVFDYKEAEKELNQMLEKGYMFKGTGKGYIKNFAMYKKSHHADKFLYAVDVKPEGSEKQLEKYDSFYEDLGWKKVDCHQKKLHIFISEKDKDVLPLYTDTTTEFENLKEAVSFGGQIGATTFLVAVCSALIAFTIKIGGISDSRLISYIFIVFFLLMASLFVINLINNILYINKCSKDVEMGLAIPQNFLLKKMRFAENLFNICTFFALPLAVITGYIYKIWGNGVQTELYWGAFTYILFAVCILSLPILLFSTYKLFFNPNSSNYKTLSFVGYFMYYMSTYLFFTTYLMN